MDRIMKNLLLLTLTAAALLNGCATSEFLAYQGTQQNWPTASGAMVAQAAIPVYYGLPPRPYRILGEISTSKGQTWIWSDARSEAVQAAAVEARNRGADAIMVISRDAQVTSYISTASATVVGNSAFGTGSTIPVQTGYARVTAIKFL
jgi:hypothetical protein